MGIGPRLVKLCVLRKVPVDFMGRCSDLIDVADAWLELTNSIFNLRVAR